MKERPILFQGAMVRALLAGTKTQTRRAMRYQPHEEIGALTVGMYHPTVIDSLGDEHPGAEVFGVYSSCGEFGLKCPYGQPGDRLWVREAHWWFKDAHDPATGYFPPKLTADDVEYRADGDDGRKVWRPSIHMPRWASRITLEITTVRVERLQAISEADAVAEGVAADTTWSLPWWQGYREHDGYLLHQQVQGETPPDWMLEPKPMRPLTHLNRSARDVYLSLWEQINGPGSWDANPWVWVVEFRRMPA